MGHRLRWPAGRLPRWVARLVWLLGLVSLLSALVPALRSRLAFVHELLPPFVPQVADAATLTVGIALMTVAGGLRRRKRTAWWAAVALAAGSALLHLLKALDVEEAAFSLGVLAVLVLARREFAAVPDPPRRGRTAARVLAAPVLAVGLGSAYLWLRHRELVAPVSPGGLLMQAAAGLVGLDGPLGFASPVAAGRASVVLGTLGLITVAVVLVALLRPVRASERMSALADPRLRALVDAEGRHDSLAYFALRADKSVLFSPTGKAAIAYRVVGGVSLASGDPVGDPEAWPGAITAWLDEARAHAWVPAVLGAGERAATVYARHGLDALELGDEAVLTVEEFTLEGREMRSVRQAVNRVRRAGTRVAIERTGCLDPADVDAVREAAAAWRDAAVERGFSMALGRLGDAADPRCVLATAYDTQGVPVGLLHLVPWGRDGLSLDRMQRRADADNGLVEFLVTEVVRAAPALGVRRISLNFAVFRSVFARGERVGAGPVLRVWRRVLLVASRFWQIESLYRSNAKFRPEWVPRFVCFPTPRDLPQVTLAALRAEAFLTAPRPRRSHPGSPRPPG